MSGLCRILRRAFASFDFDHFRKGVPMRRLAFSREESRHLTALQRQILKCLDVARLIVLLGFKELSQDGRRRSLPHRRRRRRKLAAAWLAATVLSTVMGASNGIDTIDELLLEDPELVWEG